MTSPMRKLSSVALEGRTNHPTSPQSNDNEVELQGMGHQLSCACQSRRIHQVVAAEGEVGELCMAA